MRGKRIVRFFIRKLDYLCESFLEADNPNSSKNENPCQIFIGDNAYNLQRTFHFRENHTEQAARTNPQPPAALRVRAARTSGKGKRRPEQPGTTPAKRRSKMCSATHRRPWQILVPTASERWQWMFPNTWTARTQSKT